MSGRLRLSTPFRGRAGGRTTGATRATGAVAGVSTVGVGVGVGAGVGAGRTSSRRTSMCRRTSPVSRGVSALATSGDLTRFSDKNVPPIGGPPSIWHPEAISATARGVLAFFCDGGPQWCPNKSVPVRGTGPRNGPNPPQPRSGSPRAPGTRTSHRAPACRYPLPRYPHRRPTRRTSAPS
jgi:hypothetical protein